MQSMMNPLKNNVGFNAEETYHRCIEKHVFGGGIASSLTPVLCDNFRKIEADSTDPDRFEQSHSPKQKHAWWASTR